MSKADEKGQTDLLNSQRWQREHLYNFILKYPDGILFIDCFREWNLQSALPRGEIAQLLRELQDHDRITVENQRIKVKEVKEEG